MESWVTIPHYPNYKISNLGQVHNERFNRPVKPRKTQTGVYIVSLCDNGKKQRCVSLHKLVAENFIPFQSTDGTTYSIRHINGDKADNRSDNLRWVPSNEGLKNYHATSIRATVKQELLRGDVELYASKVSASKFPYLYYQWEGKYHKVRKFYNALVIHYTEDGETKHLSIAEDVITRHLGPAPTPDHVIGYKDFDYWNLSRTNLLWETRPEKHKRWMAFAPPITLDKLAERGKSIQQKRLKITERTKARILGLKAKGLTCAAIGRSTNISASSISRLLRLWESEEPSK